MNNNKQSIVNKEFVPYKESLELGQLGFDEFCFAWYVSENYGLEFGSVVKDELIRDAVLAPTFSQAFRFFREKYNLRGFIGFRPNVKQFDHHIYDMSISGIEYTKQRTMAEYNKDPLVGTYEESELACLKKLIEIVKR